MRSRITAIIAAIALVFSVVLPPAPAIADLPLVAAQGTLTASGQSVVLQGLAGQSSCNVEVVSDAGMTLNFQAIVNSTWTSVYGTTPDNSSTVDSVTTAGTWIVNCASFRSFRVLAAGAGTAVVNLTSSSGVGRVLSSGVNGGKTIIAGSGPITVTNSGNTATVGLQDPLSIMYGGTGATALPTGCLQSNGTAIISTTCPTPGPTASPVSVVGGTNITVTTPSPGVFDVSTVPNPTFTSVTATDLTPGNCLFASTGGLIQDGSTISGASFVVPTGSGGTLTSPNILGLSAGPLPQAIVANSTLKVTDGVSTLYGLASTNYASGFSGTVGVIFTSSGSVTYPYTLTGGGSSYTETTAIPGGPSNYASTTQFSTFTYTFPSASTVTIPTGTMVLFQQSPTSYFYATTTTSITPGSTSVGYYVQGTAGGTPSSINNVNILTLTPGTFGSGQGCVSGINAGSNITVSQASPGIYTISATTPSPAATYSAGNGIAITGQVISNTGAITVAAGSNVTVATSSPGIYTVSAITPSPAPTSSPVSVQAGTGIAVATPSPGVFVVSNAGVTGVTGSSNIQVSSGATPVVTLTNAPSISGALTAGTTSGTNFATELKMPNATSGCGTSDIISNTTNSTGVGLVPAYVFGITCDSNPGINYMSMDDNGDFQVAGNSGGNTLYAANLSAGGCLAATNFGTYYGQIGVTPCVSVTPGSGISVATPSAGVYQVTNTGVLSASGSGNITVTAGATPLVSITNAPSFTGNVTAGNVTDSALTSGNCVQASTGGLLTTTAAACGSGSGGVTSVTGSGNIQVTAGATPVVTITNAPNFTSNITVGTNGTANAGILFAAASGHTVEQVNGSQTVATISGTAINFNNGSTSYASMDQSGNLGLTGSLHATSFYGSGANITTGTIPDAALVTAPVTSLTAGSNIVVGSGSTPTVAVTNQPSFAGAVVSGTASTLASGGYSFGSSAPNGGYSSLHSTTASGPQGVVGNYLTFSDSSTYYESMDTSGDVGFLGYVAGASLKGANLTSGDCVQSTTGGQLVSASGACGTGTVTGLTAGSNVVVGSGATPSVAVTNAPTFTGALSAASVTATGLTSGNCVQASTGGLLTTATGACSTGTVTGLTAGNGIVVGTGPTPSVALANSFTVSGNIITTGGAIQSGAPNGAANGILGMGNTLSSGGYTAFSSGSTTSVNGVAGNMFLVNGSVNNSMALDLNGNLGIFGGLHAANLTDTALTSGDCVQAGTGGLLSSATGGACPINYRGGTLQGGMHIETFTGSMTASTTTAFTFGTAYTTAPYCVVSTVANGAPVLSIAASPAISTTSVSVYNSSGSAANGNVSCIGY